jgi:hypothetical protein
MKNTKILLAILAVALVFAMTVTGCATDGGSPANTEPKNIIITGIDNDVFNVYKEKGATILVTPVGTATNNPSGKHIALLNCPKEYVQNPLYLPLYITGSNPAELWKGNGVYDLWLFEGNEGFATSHPRLNKASSINISKADTTVAFSSFTQVDY